jgi:hypothetical protein
MGQELFDAKHERKPRVYYLATTTSGMKFVRGSWIDKYTHAVVCDYHPQWRENQSETWGTCHGRKELAERRFKNWQKYKKNNTDYQTVFELVELVKITAKEFRAIKKQTKKEYQEYREARDKEMQEETESQ